MSDPLWDRLKEAFGILVRAQTSRFDYGALYAATVKSQASDLTVGLIFDDSRWPPVDGVPMRQGAYTAKVSVGARVVVAFENQDPSKPRAMLWEAANLLELHVDPSIATVFSGGTKLVARVDDSVGIASTALAWFTAVGTATGAGTPPDTIGTITSGASKVKA